MPNTVHSSDQLVFKTKYCYSKEKWLPLYIAGEFRGSETEAWGTKLRYTYWSGLIFSRQRTLNDKTNIFTDLRGKHIHGEWKEKGFTDCEKGPSIYTFQNSKVIIK
jgi:hypothetical protein